MTNYLVRTEATGAAPSMLLHFANEDDLKLTALEQLESYLTNLILLNCYTGTGTLIKAMWRWNDDDFRTVLELTYLKDIPEVDGVVDQYYEVRGKGTDEVI